MQYRDTPAEQMLDWLKKHYSDFPKVSQKRSFDISNSKISIVHVPFTPLIRNLYLKFIAAKINL